MCTRILWKQEQPLCSTPTVVGRSMEWFKDKPLETYLRVFPRNLKRTWGTDDSNQTWKSDDDGSKYGSIGTTVSWIDENGQKVTGTLDGINEKRLAGHLLWLEPFPHEPPKANNAADTGGDAEAEKKKKSSSDQGKKLLTIRHWLQYCLDNFSTVAEVEEWVKKNEFRLDPLVVHGLPTSMHLAVEDASGQGLIVHFDPKSNKFICHRVAVITNTDTCTYTDDKVKGKQNDPKLPGSSSSDDRFHRAVWYLHKLPPPKDERETIAYLMSVLRNVSVPFQVDREKKKTLPPDATWWRSVCDLSNGYYYFDSALSPNLIWLDLDDFDFEKEREPKCLRVGGVGPDPAGNVRALLKPYPHLAISP